MSLSFALTEAFTRTHARYLASKVVSDLYQCSRMYGSPAPGDVPAYETELVELLVGGYVDEYEFGFQRNMQRIVSWSYHVAANGDLIGGDDRAGGVYARASIANASYFNHVSYSSKWFGLSEYAKTEAKRRLPIQRVTGNAPADGNGHWISDRSYSNGGVTISRRTFRPL